MKIRGEVLSATKRFEFEIRKFKNNSADLRAASETEEYRNIPRCIQCCQVRDFIPRSRDFFNQLGCFWDFYFKNSISGFFWDFSELQVLNLVINFFVKLAR